jgi:hypothetical protein
LVGGDAVEIAYQRSSILVEPALQVRNYTIQFSDNFLAMNLDHLAAFSVKGQIVIHNTPGKAARQGRTEQN